MLLLVNDKQVGPISIRVGTSSDEQSALIVDDIMVEPLKYVGLSSRHITTMMMGRSSSSNARGGFCIPFKAATTAGKVKMSMRIITSPP